MHRIDTPNALPGGLFQDGSPIQKATFFSADWSNAVQEEIANVVEAFGLSLDKLNNAQLLAILQSIKSNIQVITTSQTVVAPSYAKNAIVSLVAGGGGGAGGIDLDIYPNTLYGSSGGGGGGGIYRQVVNVTPGASYNVTIGQGGAGGAVHTNGASGGVSSFDALSVPGGGGGSINLVNPGLGNIGGVAGGNFASNGASGDYFEIDSAQGSKLGSSGGGSLFGSGANANYNTVNANAYGAGGLGGRVGFGGNPSPGGNGSSGICIIEW